MRASLLRAPDWRTTIYGDRYPTPIVMNVDTQYNYWGNDAETPGRRYVDRGRKTH